MYPRGVFTSSRVLVFLFCMWLSSVARSCATKDANNKDYVWKPSIPAGINCPPPSKTISPITWFGTISTEVPRSTGHIMVTTLYSDQQGSKSRQKVMRLYKRWHRAITKRFVKPPLLYIESSLDRLGLLSPTHDQRSQQQIGQIRSNQF